MSETRPIWSPSEERKADSNMARFIAFVHRDITADVDDYDSLYRWSIDHPQTFWPAVWRFCGIKASHYWSSVLEDGDKMPGAKWFPGARLNFAENLLSRLDDKPALVFWNENGHQTAMSYDELHTQVGELAMAMRLTGIQAGDRVAGFMPNRPETIVAMLATASIGAVWSSCSPDFGVDGAVERFGQIAPKLFFSADGYIFKGKHHDSLAKVDEIVARIPSVEQVVIVPYLKSRPDIRAVGKSVLYHQFLANSSVLIFEQLPFDHPLYILFSSGTTGKPKCIVHGAGGTLIQHLKELVLHSDLKSDDTLFYFTTCGWMMWNWMASGLATGATLVLYDGSPFHPDTEILFKMIEQEGITHFGTSAKYISALEKADAKPAAHHDLSQLRVILSTGSPLLPESYDYIYSEISSDLQVASISGGTDIVSCFALGNPLRPVYRGELQSRGLGMRVEVFDEAGNSVHNQKGELVCTAPAPSMPIYFWNDDGRRYQDAYFSRWPNVWAHGDYAELTDHDGMIIYGRSDAVLNPGGVRIGTAEIYRQVEKLPEVMESIVVGQEWQGDVRVVLFVRLRNGSSLDNELTDRIKQQIRSNTTPRHVPAKVIQVDDIPRTISGKIVELAVRNVIHGRPVTNIEALANPDALKQFENIAALQE